MKVIFIIGGIMLVIAVFCNILAIILEKKYKNKMRNISKE